MQEGRKRGGSRRRRTRVIFPLSLSFPFSFLLPTLRRRIAFHKSGGRGRREGSSELRPTLARWPYVPSPSNPTRQGLVGRGLRKRTVEDRTFLPPPHSPFRIRNNSLDCRFAHAIYRGSCCFKKSTHFCTCGSTMVFIGGNSCCLRANMVISSILEPSDTEKAFLPFLSLSLGFIPHFLSICGQAEKVGIFAFSVPSLTDVKSRVSFLVDILCFKRYFA